MRGAGLVAALVVTIGFWAYGRVGGTSTSATRPAYCQDVDRVTTVLTDVRGGAVAYTQAPALASIATSLTADASAATRSGRSIAAASLTRLAADVTSWRTSIVTGNAVSETIALDRILSETASVPGC